MLKGATMRKLLLVIPLALALAGCGTTSVFQGGTSLTATVANPVTPAMLYQVENGAIVAFSGLNAYRDACIAKTAVVYPKCRTVIPQLQVYTRQIPGPLKEVRKFVRANDQVNAITAYNTVRALLDQFKATALANGVN
jgi:hypothetical protein